MNKKKHARKFPSLYSNDSPLGLDMIGLFMHECVRGRQVICRDPVCCAERHCKHCTIDHSPKETPRRVSWWPR